MVQLCWAQSHFNIAGNEATDKEAREAIQTLQVDDIKLISHSDYYPQIESKLWNKWQGMWRDTNNNNLRIVKDNSQEWASSHDNNRRRRVIITRSRIGHTLLTHKYLIDGRHLPCCENCVVPLSVRHILKECPTHEEDRLVYFRRRDPFVKDILAEQPYGNLT